MIQGVEVLALEDISKTFPNGDETLTLFSHVNIRLESGKSISITGESASGKSTFLHIAAGLERPTSGQVHWRDGNGLVDISRLKDARMSRMRSREAGFIFQNNFLLEDFTPLENIMIPCLIIGETRARARDKALQLLERFDLTYLSCRPISKLSGGEKQRVAICRALANDPAMIFADEPTGALDEENAGKVENMLLGLCTACGLLLVTHNKAFASRCDEQYKIEGKELVRIS